MKIRKMTIEDYKSVYKLWTTDTGVGLRSLDDSRDGIGKFLARNPETCFAAELDGELIGSILCGNDSRRGYIYHAMVCPENRGIGIGKALVDNVLEALKQLGINKTALVVFSSNVGGIEFWRRMGFTLRDDLMYMDKSINDKNV